MPRPSERTRSKKRVHKALPGGSGGTSYRRKVPTLSHCSLCKRSLAGTSNTSPLKARKLNRSKRRIWRPFGGQLCPDCLKHALKQGTRAS